SQFPAGKLRKTLRVPNRRPASVTSVVDSPRRARAGGMAGSQACGGGRTDFKSFAKFGAEISRLVSRPHSPDHPTHPARMLAGIDGSLGFPFLVLPALGQSPGSQGLDRLSEISID